MFTFLLVAKWGGGGVGGEGGGGGAGKYVHAYWQVFSAATRAVGVFVLPLATLKQKWRHLLMPFIRPTVKWHRNGIIKPSPIVSFPAGCDGGTLY